ncbi:integral membrane [Diplodia corticola]|uniref:Integral membrane n=1 Tax=Diplodia corticola TaxID=236234 RepID=A0A1J9RTR0_9PEZI|nr:integral membrane [Diplodia corticola]OJD35947.1 integral membrane [Diplodia corticola]
MADAAREAAAKQRIVSHMNADHQDSVARYLEHYCNVSSFTARKARLTDMSLGSLTIEAGSRKFTIPLEPPMQAWREARERVIQMDRDCLAGLGRSDITVKQYTRPRGAHAVIFVVCALTDVLVSRRANALPGSFIYTHVLSYSPGFASFVAQVQPVVLALMIGIHVVEASIMARRLQRHNVAQLSGLWWLWVASCFIEGFGALQRVDALVHQGRREKDKQKH